MLLMKQISREVLQVLVLYAILIAIETNLHAFYKDPQSICFFREVNVNITILGTGVMCSLFRSFFHSTIALPCRAYTYHVNYLNKTV